MINNIHVLVKVVYSKDSIFIDKGAFEKYARDDARDHWRLWVDVEEPKLRKEGKKIWKLFHDMEMSITRVIMEMEESGLFVNVEGMEALSKKNDKEVSKLLNGIWNYSLSFS